MEKRFAHRKATVLAAATAAAGLAGFSASQADASLIIDVRATSVNGSSAGVDSKTVAVSPGDVVTMGVFAQVSGTNGINDETFSIANGSFQSSTGGLLGNLNNVLIAPTFTQTGSANGNQSDFDSDGDLDVGSLGTTAANKMAARANPAVSGTPLNSDTMEVQISTLTFTVAAGGNGSTAISFIPRPINTGATWNEDGQATVKTPGAGGTYLAGAPVNIAVVPEPASIGLLSVAALGLLARRRDKKA